jgi:hypothetical protein
VDRRRDPSSALERVPVPRLAEAADQDVIARLEEEDLGLDALLRERANDRVECRPRVAGPDVEDQRHPLVPDRA